MVIIVKLLEAYYSTKTTDAKGQDLFNIFNKLITENKFFTLRIVYILKALDQCLITMENDKSLFV